MIRGGSATASGLAGASVYCSWSGGKDSALALHEAIDVGAEPRFLVDQLLAAGFQAVIVAVRDGVLPPSLLGRTLDGGVLAEIEAAGADACGENGEFHTFVVDGPIFQAAVDVDFGERSLRDDVWFVDLLPQVRLDSGGGGIRTHETP